MRAASLSIPCRGKPFIGEPFVGHQSRGAAILLDGAGPLVSTPVERGAKNIVSREPRNLPHAAQAQVLNVGRLAAQEVADE